MQSASTPVAVPQRLGAPSHGKPSVVPPSGIRAPVPRTGEGGGGRQAGQCLGWGWRGEAGLSPERRAVRDHAEPPAPCQGAPGLCPVAVEVGLPSDPGAGSCLGAVPLWDWSWPPAPCPGTALHLLPPPGVFLRPPPLSSRLAVTPPTCGGLVRLCTVTCPARLSLLRSWLWVAGGLVSWGRGAACWVEVSRGGPTLGLSPRPLPEPRGRARWGRGRQGPAEARGTGSRLFGAGWAWAVAAEVPGGQEPERPPPTPQPPAWGCVRGRAEKGLRRRGM